MLLSEEELWELTDDSQNIFKKSNIDCYIERPNAVFGSGKKSILNDLCSSELLAYYTLENKTCEYQADEFF